MSLCVSKIALLECGELGTPAKTAEEAKARQRRASARATAAAEEEEEAREAPGAAGVAMYGEIPKLL
eukprot:gene8849-10486_t